MPQMTRTLVARLTISAAAFIGLLLLSSLADIANARETRLLLAHLGDVVAPRLLESSEFDTHVTRAIREIQTYALGGEEDELDEATAALQAAYDDLAALDTMHSHDHDLNAVEGAYHELNERRRALLDELALALNQAERTTSDAALFAVIESIEREIESLSADSRLALDRERAVAAELAAQRVRQNFLVIAFGLGVPILFSLAALRYLSCGIVRPIRELADATLAFAHGRLQAPVPVRGDDEIAVLQRSFNTLVETIRQQTRELTEQASVAAEIRAQALAAQRLASDLVQRNAQIAAQAAALQAEVAERQLAEAALIQARDAALTASRAKSAFLATMSHELRTPLNAILGFSQLIAQMHAEQDHHRIAQDLGYIQAAGHHLLALIDDVLDLSRIEAGRLPVVCAEFDLATLVNQVAITTSPLFQRGRNSFAVILPPAPGTMFSDETRVRQALLNLLSNAAKFTEDGKVTLSLELADRDGVLVARFSVADTGIGIHASQLPRLFQTFSQLDDSATRRAGGAGLGLALSQRLANALGGAISVQSTYGAGSRFTLELPTRWQGPLDAAAPSPSTLAAPGAGIATFPSPESDQADGATFDRIALCIDDDPSAASLLKQQLRAAHIAVVHAASGQDGLELARDLLPDLIILDLLMPELDGWAVLAQLRADPELAAIPVVMLSVDDQQPFDPACGADAHLVKPVDPGRLLAVVTGLVGARPALHTELTDA